jgi:hypothetical protein
MHQMLWWLVIIVAVWLASGAAIPVLWLLSRMFSGTSDTQAAADNRGDDAASATL